MTPKKWAQNLPPESERKKCRIIRRRFHSVVLRSAKEPINFIVEASLSHSTYLISFSRRGLSSSRLPELPSCAREWTRTTTTVLPSPSSLPSLWYTRFALRRRDDGWQSAGACRWNWNTLGRVWIALNYAIFIAWHCKRVRGGEKKMENEINPPRRLATYDIFIGVELTLLESVKSSCGNSKQGEKKAAASTAARKESLNMTNFPTLLRWTPHNLWGGRKSELLAVSSVWRIARRMKIPPMRANLFRNSMSFIHLNFSIRHGTKLLVLLLWRRRRWCWMGKLVGTSRKSRWLSEVSGRIKM